MFDGKYALGTPFFSDLTHYVRSGDFVRNLLRDARTADELKQRVGISYCQVTPANPDDLHQVAAGVGGLDGIDIDVDTNSLSVFAPDGVATLVEVFRRVDALGVEVADISLRKPSLDEAFLHLTERTVTQS